MTRTQWSTVVVAGVVGSLILSQSQAWAITASGFLPAFEQFIVTFVNFVTQVLIPAAGVIGLAFILLNIFFAFVRLGARVALGVAALCAVGGGLPWLSSWSGIPTTFIG